MKLRECDIRCSFATSTKDKCSCKCDGEGHGQGWIDLKKQREEEVRDAENL